MKIYSITHLHANDRPEGIDISAVVECQRESVRPYDRVVLGIDGDVPSLTMFVRPGDVRDIILGLYDSFTADLETSSRSLRSLLADALDLAESKRGDV